MYRFRRIGGRATLTAIGLALTLVLAGSCKKKPDAKKSDAPAGDMQAGDMTADPGMEAMRAAPDAMRAAPDPMRARPAASGLKMDDALKKKLTEQLKSSSDKALGSIRKSLTSVQKTFGSSPQAKMAYAQVMQSVELLAQIAKKVKDGAFAEVPALAATGFVFATMGVTHAADLAKSLARRATSAAKKLQIGKAKKLAREGRALGALGRTIGRVVKRYALMVEALMKQGGEKVRVAAVEAATKVYPKVSKATQAIVAKALKQYYKAEKSASVKAQIKKLLEAIKVAVD